MTSRDAQYQARRDATAARAPVEQEVSPIKRMADYYVGNGWHVFPVNGRKEPARPGHGFKDATLDADQFKRGDGVAIATGQISGLVVVDLDEKGGAHGIAEFKKICEGHPDIVTRTVKTPTGGAHLYFKHSGPLKGRIGHPAPGIDFKADGGYVVAPPSVLDNGDYYKTVKDIEPCILPDWLKEVMSATNGTQTGQAPVTAKTEPGKPTTTRLQTPFKIPDKIPEGSRDDTIYKLACSLSAKGNSDSEVLEKCISVNREKCKPPLDDNVVTKKVQSAVTFNRQNPPTTTTAPPPIRQARQAQIIIEPVDPVVQARADEILKTGRPLDLLKTAFDLNHEGDYEILRAVVYGSCLQSSRTTHGLQVFISGSKGTGKSNAIKAAINLIPPDHVTQGSFSDKAFFLALAGRIKPAVFLDDITISDSQVATMKRAMTNFQTPTDHHTLSGPDRKFEIQTIPARTMWLGTAVSETGDDQLKNRYLSLDIIPGEKDNSKYIDWELKRRQEGRPEIEINDDVKTARAIIGHIKTRDFIVKGFENIRFKYNHDRRLINIALDLIEGSAILHYLQRDHAVVNGVIHVIPTKDDLDAALDFTMFRITDTRSDGRITRSERALDVLVQEKMGTRDTIELTEREFVDLSGKTTTPIRTLLYGRGGTQNTITGGLLEKASWYRIDREMVEGRRMGQAVIVVSKHSYGHETIGSFAWLENADGTAP